MLAMANGKATAPVAAPALRFLLPLLVVATGLRLGDDDTSDSAARRVSRVVQAGALNSTTLQQPVIILGLGPTGSGKSSQETYIYQALSNEHKVSSEFTSSLIDDLVENDDGYKRYICDFLKSRGLSKDSADDDIMKFLNSAEPVDYLSFKHAYYGARKTKGCEKYGAHSCDEYNDLKTAQDVKAGFAVLEATGERGYSHFEWIIDAQYLPPGEREEFLRESRPEIFLGVNVIDFCTLRRRNQNRFVFNTKRFLTSDCASAAPRLPNLGKAFKTVVDNTIDNLGDFLRNPEQMRTVNGVYIFDNNEQLMLSVKIDTQAPDFETKAQAGAAKLEEMRARDCPGAEPPAAPEQTP
eukprot:TRINITY_DN120727_c0_g1_i1.p1 TRINITY_DN120727_c0_g1~~TRINITY_DN120727_c0_g1_i1.p1  ORF type:complete len:353 (-),score=47.99 TRINITY_DN120727_c0_g1_i1:129-1187(-)